MSNAQVLRYKGYIGTAEMSFEDNCLFGKLLYINDLVNYEGETPDELEQSFHDAVDGYLEFCKEIGKDPDISCSGNFNVRINPKLHYDCVKQARTQNISLNQFIANCLDQSITKLNADKQILDTLHIIKSDVIKMSQTLSYSFTPTNLPTFESTIDLMVIGNDYYEHKGAL